MTAVDIIAQGTTAAGFANVLVNAVRISYPSLKAIPLVALVAAIGIAFLLAMANGVGFDRAAIAFTVLVGISGGGGAMLIAMGQSKANDKANTATSPAAPTVPYDVRKDQPL